jgi:hypothetical protein
MVLLCNRSKYAFPELEISSISLEELRNKRARVAGLLAKILKRELRNTNQEWQPVLNNDI